MRSIDETDKDEIARPRTQNAPPILIRSLPVLSALRLTSAPPRHRQVAQTSPSGVLAQRPRHDLPHTLRIFPVRKVAHPLQRHPLVLAVVIAALRIRRLRQHAMVRRTMHKHGRGRDLRLRLRIQPGLRLGSTRSFFRSSCAIAPSNPTGASGNPCSITSGTPAGWPYSTYCTRSSGVSTNFVAAFIPRSDAGAETRVTIPLYPHPETSSHAKPSSRPRLAAACPARTNASAGNPCSPLHNLAGFSRSRPGRRPRRNRHGTEDLRPDARRQGG